MKKLLCYAVILAMFPVCGLFAQIPLPPGNIQSPNAASLGLYGEYPVSYFTGVPQIGIPLHKLGSGNLSVPITMNYHASGFRPDQHPGWVGSGWNLEAGGAISRTVHDLPDDFNNSNFYQGANAGFFFNYGILNVSNWNSIPYMQSIARGDASLKDTEPDEFSFSLPDGRSGKFYRNHLGEWKVQADQLFKVTFENTFLNVPFTAPYDSPYTTYLYYKSFSGFTITDDHGIQYVFGGTTDAIEYSMPFFSQNESHWIADSWYLTKVYDPSYNDVITLDYARDSYINQMYIAAFMDLGTSAQGSGGIFNPQPACSSTSWGTIDTYYEGQLVSPVYLEHIIAGNEQINFLRSNSTELGYSSNAYSWKYSQWLQYNQYYSQFLPFLESGSYNTYPACLDNLHFKQLDQVQVYVDGFRQKTFNFSYSNSSSQRLTLQSITEQGKNSGLLKPYAFTYNTSASLPGYLANMSDHWGFYNGTNASLNNLTAYYNLRNPNATYLLAGTLSRITYPTGGVTDFTFEPNNYRKQLPAIRESAPVTLSANTLAGGLRIRKVSSYDPNLPDQKVEKEYFYVDGYSSSANVSTLASSGILGGQIKYWFDDYQVRAFNDHDIVYKKSMFSSQSVLPASINSQGSHIGYSTVIEKRNDGSYTKYQFSNFDDAGFRDERADNVLQISREIYEPYTSTQMNRGRLLVESNYSSSNVLLRTRTRTYDPINAANEQVRSLKARYFNVCPNTAVSAEEGTAYRYYTYGCPASNDNIVEYDQNGQNPLQKYIHYNYDATYRVVKTAATYRSQGRTDQSFVIRYRYPFDISVGNNTPNVYAYEFPVLWLRQHNVIFQPLETVTTLNENVIAVDINTFAGYGETSLVPKARYTLKAIQPFPVADYVPYSANSGQSGEPMILDSRVKLTDEYTYSSFSPLLYENLMRPTETRPYRAPVNSYLWGYAQKHLVAEVKNSERLDIAYSSFETTEPGYWTYSGARSTDATAPTGRYVYNLSGGAISKTGLTSTKKYLLTYWAKSATAAGISGGTASVVRTFNGWTLYSRVLTGVTSLSISGTVPVDEVRLNLIDGQMKTYTYNEQGGITTETDAKGYTKYYTYDEFNRLVTVKDNDGHLLEDYTYHLR